MSPPPAPPGRAARWLDRTLRIVDEGPRPFYRAALASLAVTSVLAVTMAALIRPPGSLPAAQRYMITGALVALLMSTALAVASLVAGDRCARRALHRPSGDSYPGAPTLARPVHSGQACGQKAGKCHDHARDDLAKTLRGVLGGKERRFGRTIGRKRSWKKAYVRLAEGQEINFAATE